MSSLPPLVVFCHAASPEYNPLLEKEVDRKGDGDDYFDLRDIAAVGLWAGKPLHLDPGPAGSPNLPDFVYPDLKFRKQIKQYLDDHFIVMNARHVAVNPACIRGACYRRGNIYLENWTIGLYWDNAEDRRAIEGAGLIPVSSSALVALDKAFMIDRKEIIISQGAFVMRKPYKAAVMQAVKARWLPWKDGFFNPEQVRFIRGRSAIFFDTFTSIPMSEIPIESRRALEWANPWYQLQRGVKINLRCAFRPMVRRKTNQVNLGCGVSFPTGKKRQLLNLLDLRYRIPNYRMGGEVSNDPARYLSAARQAELRALLYGDARVTA